MQLSIIIVNYNVYNDVVSCIDSIVKYSGSLSFEIIVIDNNSPEREIENINKAFPAVKFIQLKENFGFGYANNIGMKNASGEYFFLVNPDIFFTDFSIQILYDFISNNELCGVVGPVQVKPGKGIEYYYTFFPSIYSRLMQEFRMYMTAPGMKKKFFNFLDENIAGGMPFRVDWVIGSCMMLRAEIFEKTGGFDEAFFLYEEETEWQYRISKLGWQTFMVPTAKVLHNHHSSAGKIGTIFVNYHEFRSRIIFDTKRFRGIKFFIRYLLINAALLFRIFYFLPKSVISGKTKKKLLTNLDLLKLNNSGNSSILKNRFNFEDKKKLFT